MMYEHLVLSNGCLQSYETSLHILDTQVPDKQEQIEISYCRHFIDNYMKRIFFESETTQETFL